MSRQQRSPYYHHMNTRSEQCWVSLIMKIDNKKLRMKAAAVVWWDWFSLKKREAHSLKTIFAEFRDSDNYRGIEEDLQRELVRMEYRKGDAAKRSTLPRPEDKRRGKNG